MTLPGAPVALAVSDELPRETLPPLTRTDVVRYAGAGGDLNPIHHDEPLAQAGGFPGVFAMGQLSAGILGIRLARWVGPDQVRAFSCRFTGQVWPGDALTLSGRVAAIEDGVAAIELAVERAPGDVVVQATARAVVARPGLPPLADVEAAIRASWARETSDDPELWSEENRALGQCAVSALVVRAIYGGELLIATVLDRDGSATPDGHAWNVLPDGTVVDWAFEQFRDGEQLDVGLVTEPVIHPDPRRAHLMAQRVSERLGGFPIELPAVR